MDWVTRGFLNATLNGTWRLMYSLGDTSTVVKCLWSRYGLGHAWFPKCYLERHMEANVQSGRYINSSNVFIVDIVE